MLRVLRIENIAVARDVELELHEGFSVLTGETGAGKSILIDGLGIVLGERASKDMIRSGEKSARVSAIFTLSPSEREKLLSCGVEPDSEGELYVVRTLTDDGKSTAKLNGRNIPVSLLREIAPILVNINDQNDSHAMLDRATHIELLDEYSGVSLGEYSSLYEKYQESVKHLGEIRESLRDSTMMTDILKYQIREIESAKLSDPEEEQKLERLRLKLKGAERISKYTGIVKRALYESEKGATASYMIERAESAIEHLSDVMDNSAEICQRLESIKYELIDIAEQTQDLLGEGMEYPEERLDQVEKRLSLIYKLEKKYGANITEILDFLSQSKKKLDTLESGDLAVKEAERDIESSYKVAYECAKRISDIRKENAKKLAEGVGETLVYLDMPKARFDIELCSDRSPDGKEVLNPRGIDNVSFMFSANTGYPMRELSKIASGGELSRTMLAVKCALSGKQGSGTVVFDEIDTGVSGATSRKIGMKLKELSKTAQVISVTHSPQVASLADSHYLIRKKDVAQKTESSVTLLTDEERVSEIARIIGGINVTDKQTDAAREMIDNKN